MAYGYGGYGRRRRRSSVSRTRMPRGRYARRRTTRRRRSSRQQRIVIQVVGGPGGAVPVGVTAGKKGKRTIRARF